MDCETVRNQTIAEKYVTRRLPESERDEYEEHYFACEQCFAELVTLQAVKSSLASMSPAKITPAPKPLRMRYWLMPIAAALLFIFFRPRTENPAPKPAPATSQARDYSSLARVEPMPAWNAVLLRGPEKPDRVLMEKARAAFSARDYAGCASTLAPLTTPEATYYQGVCQLLARNPSAAASSLQKTIASGDTPYLEEARFYLAKAFLATNNPAAARDQLQNAIALHGDLERRANELLQQLN